MITRIGYLLVGIFLLGAVLASCESTPGEVSGAIKYADGRGASVKIVLTSTAGVEAWSGTSDTDGVFYSGKVVPAGTYKVTLFKGDGTPIAHEAKTVDIRPDGTATLLMTI